MSNSLSAYQRYQLSSPGEQLGSVQRLVLQDQSRQAYHLFKDLSENKQNVILQFPISENKKIQAYLSEAQVSLESMIGLPEMQNILTVLGGKIESFHRYVSQNNWRTLTRISNMLEARTSNLILSLSNQRPLSEDRLQNFYEQVVTDVDQMKNITENSILSEENKRDIVRRLDGFNSEVLLLSQYVERLDDLQERFISLQNFIPTWEKEISSSYEERMGRFRQASEILVSTLVVLLLSILFFLVIGTMLYKRSRIKEKMGIQDFSLSLLRDGILPLDSRFNFKVFDQDFQKDFAKLRTYIHNRMSFGAMFQEGMPFSALMLDSNLHVAWGNKLFYEAWGLDTHDSKEDSISWDYLQKFTNLGVDDPVQLALNQGIAGIYQIQVKTEKDSETRPYEMYVSPVDYAGQERILIFLYPLRSVEETIDYHINSIKGPVGRYLKAMLNDDLSVHRENLKKDFSIANIDEVFEDFETLCTNMRIQEENYLDKISELEDELKNKEEELMGQSELISKTYERLHDGKRFILGLKKSYLDCIQKREELKDIQFSSLDDLEKYEQLTGRMKGEVVRLNKSIGEIFSFLDDVTSYSQKFKSLRVQIENTRSQVSQFIDQLAVQNRMANLQSTDIFAQIKEKVKDFDLHIHNMAKDITAMDVSLSRIRLMSEDLKQLDSHDLDEGINVKLVDNKTSEVNYLVQVFDAIDAEFIHHLENVYRTIKSASQLDEVMVAEASKESEGDIRNSAQYL